MRLRLGKNRKLDDPAHPGGEQKPGLGEYYYAPVKPVPAGCPAPNME